jgi:hypothetical protein
MAELFDYPVSPLKKINEQENSMNVFMKYILAIMLGAVLVGCDQGPAEEAGEKIDDAVTDTRNAVEDACEDATDENC